MIFNVVDLYEFHQWEKSDDTGILDEWKQRMPINPIEDVEDILATRIGKTTCQKEYPKYLIKWKNRGLEDASWVCE